MSLNGLFKTISLDELRVSLGFWKYVKILEFITVFRAPQGLVFWSSSAQLSENPLQEHGPLLEGSTAFAALGMGWPGLPSIQKYIKYK